MTEPLIDRDALIDVIDEAEVAVADAVIGYLRSVLTPEALYMYALPNTAAALHRRIFGEDQ
jgi:hypothetical protein